MLALTTAVEYTSACSACTNSLNISGSSRSTQNSVFVNTRLISLIIKSEDPTNLIMSVNSLNHLQP